jgi:carbon monoxide dehydrogenase subunit G
MIIQQTVRIARSVDDVWGFLGDVPVVVGCIPGAEIGEKLADNRYRGTFRLKVGPLTAKIDGEGEIVRDDATKTGQITGRGVDKRGGSRVGASVNYSVTPSDGGSLIGVSANVDLSGPLAQIGRTGIIEDVAKRLTEEFTLALEQRLQAAQPAAVEAPVRPALLTAAPLQKSAPPTEFDAGSAVTRSLLRRIAALFGRLFGSNA